ncbi:unnamed protein product [Cylicocyclus nassatus]|uniref:ShKT domain-containing protein n=1 Tax=Cylicocyclus nassatus TaxID=53992 RepID=A0AA36H0I2_CYLNA|nr:unnamed protein product [Cylicocyclus nassatus]
MAHIFSYTVFVIVSTCLFQCARAENANPQSGYFKVACGNNKYCSSWQKNGFCTNAFYPTEFIEQWCGEPCGLCNITVP